MTLHFEKISLKQIIIFSEIISTTSLLEKEFIQKRYLKAASNFTETADFLQKIGLIAIKKDKFILNPKYKSLLKIKKTFPLHDFFVNKLIIEKTIYSDYINEYLSQFSSVNEKYECKPPIAQRLKYSGLRNFLMDLEFLTFDFTKKKYFISEKYSNVFSRYKKTIKLSQNDFLKNLQNKEELGRAAELQTIQFEKERLSHFPLLSKKIEHTAITDVMAGYDIKSFDLQAAQNGDKISIFIEVKAVSQLNYKFYWTRNEIEKASLYSKNYYLYLFPINDKGLFDLTALRIIKDPYANIYKNNTEWLRTEELLSFSYTR